VVAVWVALITATATLLGVMYTQRGQQRLSTAQRVAAADQEQQRQRRQMQVDALTKAQSAAGDAVEGFREMLAAHQAAEQEQFTVPGKGPRDTEQITAARQRCRSGVAVCDGTANLLLVLGLGSAHLAMVSLVRIIRMKIGEMARVGTGGQNTDPVADSYSELTDALRRGFLDVMGPTAL